MIIGTHSGIFHCDEVTVIMLLMLLARFKNATIRRTRDQALLEECDIVVDVGGVYDPTRLRFDHHQRGCTESWYKPSFWDWFYPRVMLSSAGMVWRHFGKEIIHELHPDLTEDQTRRIWERIYRNWIRVIDEQDTTGKKWNGPSLMHAISHLNPSGSVDDSKRDVCFQMAIIHARDAFLPYITKEIEYEQSQEKAVDIVQTAPRHLDGLIIEMSSEHMSTLFGRVKKLPYYLIFKSKDTWMVRAVPVKPGSHKSRLSLPKAWRGVRDATLDKIVDIDGCVFAHLNGFLGGHKTKEGAIEMAKRAYDKRPFWWRLFGY